jgi:hypothetical protein
MCYFALVQRYKTGLVRDWVADAEPSAPRLAGAAEANSRVS